VLSNLLISQPECGILQTPISVWAIQVVLTDYPDQALVDNLVFNVDQNIELARRGAVCAMGYVWGQSVDPLLRALLPDTADPNARPHAFFDLILLSDLIFNHSQVQHPPFLFSRSFLRDDEI
jgi:predicted nicotinamide N-methyase